MGLPAIQTKERETGMKEIGNGLERSLKDVKKIDKQITKSLQHNQTYLNKIPLIGNKLSRVVARFRTIKPLESLEGELRSTLNDSLYSIVLVGKKATEEAERIQELELIYEQAKKEEWEPSEFIKFIEDNSDIDFVVSVNDENFDMKELLSELHNQLPTENQKHRKDEYYAWFGEHLNLSKQYLKSMHALCYVGGEWAEGMSRSYFDLMQLRGGMEEIRKTLEHLGKGESVSVTSQQALRDYGTAYIKGMSSLVDGYNKMCSLKSSGSESFETSLKKLEADLHNVNNPKKALKASKKSGRFLLNPKKRGK